MPVKPLNPTAASLLGFLHHGPQTGWDLVKLADVLIGDFWSITRSQVYRELAAMAERGLVEPGPVGARERQPYGLTAKGRAAFAEWVQGDPGPETIRFPLLLTVTFGRHLPPGRLAELLAAHRHDHESRLADYQARGEQLGAVESPDPFMMATLDFGLHYERAVLAWFDGLPEILGSAADSAGADS